MHGDSATFSNLLIVTLKSKGWSIPLYTILQTMQFHPVKVGSSGQGRFSSLVKGSRHPSVIQYMIKTSYVEGLLGVWQTLPQKVKGSRPKLGYGQAVKANFGQSKFLTVVAGGTTVWSIVVTTP